jgi:hypothetical protein
VGQLGLLGLPTLSLDVQLINMILKKLLNVRAKRPPIFLRQIQVWPLGQA